MRSKKEHKAMLIEKVFMTLTALSTIVSGQLLIDIPGADFADIKDIPGFLAPITLDS
jgi:hypothetical protein